VTGHWKTTMKHLLYIAVGLGIFGAFAVTTLLLSIVPTKVLIIPAVIFASYYFGLIAAEVWKQYRGN
jgi:hypothetical protein